MNNVILYIAASIDGYIARTDGTLDWLENLPNPNQDDYGYPALLNKVGTIIMGRETYQKVVSFGEEWYYPNHNTYIATTNNAFVVSTPNTYLLTEDIDVFVKELLATSDKDIWLVGGGKLITYFLEHDLIDTIILTLIPVILGNGIPLFPDAIKETNWELVLAESYASNAVMLTYKRK